MNKVETIYTENRNKIKNITIKFPELVEKNASKLIEEEYYTILSKENKLRSLREEVRNLEEEVKHLKQEFSIKLNLFEIEFETESKEVTKSKCGVMVEGHGNSTLGKTTLF